MIGSYLKQVVDTGQRPRRRWLDHRVAALFLVAGLLGIAVPAHAQKADCYVSGVATATGNQIAPGYDNRSLAAGSLPCSNWYLIYYADNTTAVNICIQVASNNNGIPNSFACGDALNGLTNLSQGQEAISTYFPWINIGVSVLTPSGNAAIHWQLFGWRTVATLNVGDPCQNPNVAKSSTLIEVTTTAVTQFIPAVTNKTIFFCGLFSTYTAASAASGVQFDSGTGGNCGTGTVLQTGHIGTGIGSGAIASLSFGPGSTIFTAPVSTAVCATATGTNPQWAGILIWVQQ